jgi:hypothetical protein
VRELWGIDSKVDLNKGLWSLAERISNGETLLSVSEVALSAGILGQTSHASIEVHRAHALVMKVGRFLKRLHGFQGLCPPTENSSQSSIVST